MLDGVQVAVHLVSDVRLFVPNVVAVGILPLDCVS